MRRIRSPLAWLMASLLTLALLTGATSSASAQQFPGSNPLTIVVSYPPGGLSDYFARLVAAKLADSLGITVLVENKPGANGAIGTAFVARAKPDGHTISFLPASTVTTNQWLMKDMGFDPLKDLTPLTLAWSCPTCWSCRLHRPSRIFPSFWRSPRPSRERSTSRRSASARARIFRARC